MILIVFLGGVSSAGDFPGAPADSSDVPTTCLIYLIVDFILSLKRV
jgi:hypothetical protein